MASPQASPRRTPWTRHNDSRKSKDTNASGEPPLDQTWEYIPPLRVYYVSANVVFVA